MHVDEGDTAAIPSSAAAVQLNAPVGISPELVNKDEHPGAARRSHAEPVATHTARSIPGHGPSYVAVCGSRVQDGKDYVASRGCIGTRQFGADGENPSYALNHNKFITLTGVLLTNGSVASNVTYISSANLDTYDAFQSAITVTDPKVHLYYSFYFADLEFHQSTTGNTGDDRETPDDETFDALKELASRDSNIVVRLCGSDPDFGGVPMHEKFMVIKKDASQLLAGSSNLTYKGLRQSDENVLRIRDAEIVGKYVERADGFYRICKGWTHG
ncbi:phospholipase D-like domain-containing protein [Amycolatopsis lurida]